ncbi:BAG domain-containing protein Samui isoform X1 [Drosophila kikkawai]|uniref:BAG domain-containing protein Samui isoform X1 n=2 Tax=Drosophila kikkawai TaxID=30033 RepID=A0A6P4JPV0_DROKI|nr:BAG domain-containing protein Samui isoform X1 [Drosophila kikkawai]
MKPTVMTPSQAQSNAGANGAPGGGAGSGVNIPVNREYVGGAYGSPQQQATHQQHPHFQSPQATYGSPRQQFQQVPPSQQQQHFQPTFGFEPDMDMDNMFPRSHLGRMHDPFAGFGDSRKRSSLHGPNAHADDAFQSYFDDADFGFPRFSTMGRRGRMAGGTNDHMEHEDDFFNRLPSEFRQYIPDGFGARRGGAPGASHVAQHPPQQQHPQQYPQQSYGAYDVPPQQMPQPGYGVPPQQQVPQSPSKRLCDAAIQTEDPAGRSEVDCAPSANLSQHGLRNTVDMGVKSAAEQDMGLRAHSAPPPEQQQQNLQYQQQQQHQRAMPSPGAQQQQFATQTSPPIQGHQYPGQKQPQPPLKSYYAPQQQTHPQQKQQTPPPAPQTPGGTNIRTIPIFVEGRTEPIINAHKEIPTQSAPPSAQEGAETQAQSHFAQQQRPTPLNTHQELPAGVAAEGAAGLPPQTPHTLDSINKIQDIQRDVLELMGKVEQFKGTRQDKEYVYLDEMLTRNLLKLDTIDTNGKDSIRLARKEAIKCIQASINVLEAKAEENARAASGAAAATSTAEEPVQTEAAATSDSVAQVAEPVTPQPQDATKIQEPIPLPPPPNTAVPETSGAVPAEQVAASQNVAQTGTTTSTSE